MKKKEKRTYRKRGKKSTLFCSFCGRGDQEVDHLIQGDTLPTPCTVRLEIGGGYPDSVFEATAVFNPHICGECVDLCADIISENKKGGAVTPGPANHKE